MLKIKLARFGKKNQPHYRIVVNEARDKRDGSSVETLGHYAPTQTPKQLVINVELYKKWIAKGAQPTPTVASLFTRYESGNPFPVAPKKPSKKARAKVALEAEAKAAAVEAEKQAKLDAAQAAKDAKEAAAQEAAAPEVAAPATAEVVETTATPEAEVTA